MDKTYKIKKVALLSIHKHDKDNLIISAISPTADFIDYDNPKYRTPDDPSYIYDGKQTYIDCKVFNPDGFVCDSTTFIIPMNRFIYLRYFEQCIQLMKDSFARESELKDV